jgi:hypothetical protein
MSNIDDAAAKNYDAERDLTDFSPAQPDDASRIDDDNGSATDAATAPEHVKADHSGRMTH